MFELKKIIVTGASGFVGKGLMACFTSAGFDVHGVVRQGPIASSKYFNLGECGLKTDWLPLLKGREVIVHTAARVHIMNDSSPDPLSDFRKVNVDGTLNLARQAVVAGVRRLIFISSIGVNGSNTTEKLFDELSIPAPPTDYALSKLEAEEGLRELVQGSDMELVIIRPPLVYAGHAPGNFQRLMKLVALGLPLPFGSIKNQRSMIALENLVDFIALCVEHPEAANELFLISDGVNVSTPEMIYHLAEGMERKARMMPIPDQFMRWGTSLLGKQALYSQLCGSLTIDSSKAHDLLGWKPVVTPADALQQAGRDYLALHAKQS